MLTFQVFTWIQNQPTSDSWKLGIESFSFCKYQFAPRLFLSCHMSHTPRCLSPTLNTCIKWGGQLDRHTIYAQLDSYIETQLLTDYLNIRSSNLFFLHFVLLQYCVVVTQDYFFLSPSFTLYCSLCDMIHFALLWVAMLRSNLGFLVSKWLFKALQNIKSISHTSIHTSAFGEKSFGMYLQVTLVKNVKPWM